MLFKRSLILPLLKRYISNLFYCTLLPYLLILVFQRNLTNVSQSFEMLYLLLSTRFQTKNSWKDFVTYGVTYQWRVLHRQRTQSNLSLTVLAYRLFYFSLLIFGQGFLIGIEGKEHSLFIAIDVHLTIATFVFSFKHRILSFLKQFDRHGLNVKLRFAKLPNNKVLMLSMHFIILRQFSNNLPRVCLNNLLISLYSPFGKYSISLFLLFSSKVGVLNRKDLFGQGRLQAGRKLL